VVEQPETIQGWSLDKIRYVFAPIKRQGSSVVEQGTHKPLVGSSNLPPGTYSLWRGCTYFEGLQVVITLAQLWILILALRNTCGVTRIQASGSATESKQS
jgi:hypothetical protein